MKIINRRAKFDYELGKRFEAGLVLTGGEAKAVRTGHCDLSRSFAKILNGEAYLINAVIPVTGALNYDATRSRKLLLHKREIAEIQGNFKQKRLTIVATSVYTKRSLASKAGKGRLIKVEIALGKPKRKFEKKTSLKKQDILRDIQREARVKE